MKKNTSSSITTFIKTKRESDSEEDDCVTKKPRYHSEDEDSIPVYERIRHIITTQLLKSNSKYDIIKMAKHENSSSHQQCKQMANNHYHYIIEFESDYYAKCTNRGQKLIQGATAIKIKDKQHYENLINYIEKYSEMKTFVSEQEEESLKRKLKQPVDKNFSWSDDEALQSELEKARERRVYLNAKFIEGETTKNKILSAVGESPKLTKKLEEEFQEYKQLNSNYNTWYKLQPWNNQDETIMEKHQLIKKQLNVLLDCFYNKAYKQSKCPILVLAGLPSTGKSFYQSVVSEVIGKPTDLQDSQLLGDTLALDTAITLGADVLCFEEFKFRDLANGKANQMSRVFQMLKAFTSGKDRVYRTSKVTKGKLEAKTANFKAILICTNDCCSELLKYFRTDEGIMERLVLFDFNQQLTEDQRIDPNYLYKTILPSAVKYGRFHIEHLKGNRFMDSHILDDVAHQVDIEDLVNLDVLEETLDSF